MQIIQNRRRFLTGLSALAAAGLASGRNAAAAEAAPETTTARFAAAPGICIAPQYVAEELIRAEGLSDFRFVAAEAGIAQTEMLARGDIDFGIDFATALVIPVDTGAPIKVISGVHVGCYELFGREDIKSITDLKGRKVGVGDNLTSDPHIFVSAMATYVGLDPQRDIEWIVGEAKPAELFAEGKVDAFLAFPPRLKISAPARSATSSSTAPRTGRGRSITAACWRSTPPMQRKIRLPPSASSAPSSNRPTSARPNRNGWHAFWWMADAPNNTTTPCSRSASSRTPIGATSIPRTRCRFFSLRLHEAGIIKSNPNEIIANGTDWRFFNEIKREMKT